MIGWAIEARAGSPGGCDPAVSVDAMRAPSLESAADTLR
jgi:hypothetical protein